jgi:hypothetical protein
MFRFAISLAPKLCRQHVQVVGDGCFDFFS